MIITVATRTKLNNFSGLFIVDGATENDNLIFGVRNGDEIYVTEIGLAGQNDVEDEKAVAHLAPVYWSYSVEQVIKQIGLRQLSKPVSFIPAGHYYTVPEIARLLNTDRRTVNNWLNSGRLKGVKTGIGWLVWADGVEEFTPPKPGPKPSA